jgi:hypothetical protein
VLLVIASAAKQSSTVKGLDCFVGRPREIRNTRQVQEVDGGDVVDLRLLAAQLQRLGKFQHRLSRMRVVADDDPVEGSHS